MNEVDAAIFKLARDWRAALEDFNRLGRRCRPGCECPMSQAIAAVEWFTSNALGYEAGELVPGGLPVAPDDAEPD